MTIPNSDQALDAWLNQDSNREHSADYSDWKLEPVRGTLEVLLAQPWPRPITVAGTKGKGSTVAFIEAIAGAHDVPCIAFSSPHVLNLRERWRRNGALIPLADLAKLCPEVDRAIAATTGRATYFERSFFLACLLAQELRQHHPQGIFCCEVGLGGRLDCANLLDAQVACLTSLGLDHTQILGPTLQHIAREKLAIARPDAPLLIAAQSTAAHSAIVETLPVSQPHTHLNPLAPCPPLGIPGAHQAANAALALAAARHALGPAFVEDRAYSGLARAQLPGRCQLIVHGGRRLLIDGAHTAESMAATIACAEATLAPNWGMIIGIAADKDLAAVCATIPRQRLILRCGYHWQRCASADHLAWPPYAADHWSWAPDIAAALTHPCWAPNQDILISGSFYLAGEALHQLTAAS